MTETNRTEDQRVDTIGWSMPAFPSQPWNGEGYPCGELAPGLTKRELFAAMMLQSVLKDHGGAGVPEYFAKAAVVFADALLKELAK